MMDKLERVGFDDWFHDQAETELIHNHEIARVVAVHRDSCAVTKGDGETYAEYSGNLLYTSESPLDLPTTGDWVYADFYEGDAHAIIHGVLPRKTLLKRKTAGKRVDFQLIGANIDFACILQSADENFNLRRLERYLAMVNEGGITPVILLSKSDLASATEVEELKKQIFSVAPEISVTPFSNKSGENVEMIKDSLLKGKTYCLIGSSGVGKTTLLNRLLGSEKFITQTVSSKHGKGKHTTTVRELVRLENGTLLIDTPGMRELGHMAVDIGIEETFTDIAELAGHCKFRDCAHTAEKGCAILAAIQAGELNERRYNNYLKIRHESAFHEMSYSQKRKKDKVFGKMVKAVMKTKKKR
ncbi:MAG: ribosome small subunit-dependent GTPase A [Desulfofustis sp.]|nr:ribosome small subunit-dependent GTPase A [Desulfofustis sp.]